jgi:hypothetical protein
MYILVSLLDTITRTDCFHDACILNSSHGYQSSKKERLYCSEDLLLAWPEIETQRELWESYSPFCESFDFKADQLLRIRLPLIFEVSISCGKD